MMAQQQSTDPKRILVMRYRFIGDTLLSIPFLKQLRTRYPHAKIDYLAAPRSAELLEHCPYLDEVLTLDTSKNHRYEQAAPAAEEEGSSSAASVTRPKRSTHFLRYAWLLRKRHYDRAYVLKRSLSSAALAWLAGIPQRVGFNTEGRGRLLTHPVGYREDQHESLSFLQVLHESEAAFNPSAELIDSDLNRQPKPEAWWSKADEKRVKSLLTPYQDSINLVLHASSSNPAKQWPLQYFARLVSSLVNEHRFACSTLHQTPKPLVFHALGAPDDAVLYSQLRSYLPEALRSRLQVWCGALSLNESLALLRQMDGVIGVDSGTLHMAAAVGTPVVALFGPMDPVQWGPHWGGEMNPLGQPRFFKHQVVQYNASVQPTSTEPLPCQPCRLKVPCELNFKCMNELSVDAVKQASLRLLEAIQQRQQLGAFGAYDD